MLVSLPEFGTAVVYAILVSAAYTFAVAVQAGSDRPSLLRSARFGAYGTCLLIAFSVALLAYAFVTHDFRISYVARYSDRTMSTTYLLTALWGGQDGSILWWSLLLSGYVAACVRWMTGKYPKLEGYVIATLMAIVGFFAILMIFETNPFQPDLTAARSDGEGLNPLLQNYWMIIHPPSLYLGFVGCSVPFAFAVAALVTRRLDNEWIVATRRWMLFAFLFLSIGNVLGMAWAYEELGWGGFWGWDPVENAACLPWFTAAAYLHSTMMQERRNTFKVWNVVLIMLTFFLTIFGTFLTRAGLITSVHAFAKSDIGIFFVWFMGIIVATGAGLLVWRLPRLRSPARIEALASREAMFVVNNWVLLGIMTFIAVATLFPKLSELFTPESIVVGPSFFNRWLAPLGIVLFALMGVAPLFGWRKTSPAALKRAFIAPSVALAAAVALHLGLGARFGAPALVPSDPLYPGLIGELLRSIGSSVPLLIVGLAAFNVAVIVQEFVRGTRARRKAKERRDEENVLQSLVRVVMKSRRRYGGYVVHLGIVFMFLGFVGQAWRTEVEASLLPGEEIAVGAYSFRYVGPRMCPGNPRCSPEEQADVNKRMIFADLEVRRGPEFVGTVSPAKFIYHKRPAEPSTEVGLLRGLRHDIYTIVGLVNPETKRATLNFHINPLVGFVWIGLLVLLVGASVSLWPELGEEELGAWAYVRTGSTALASVAFGLGLALLPTQVFATPTAPEPALSVPVARAAEFSPPASRVSDAGAGASTGALVTALGLGLALGVGAAALSRRGQRAP